MSVSKGALPSSTTCLIAGGGPAGLMLGLLLARAGVQVVVAEKHRDFLRDFRGDTVHASTLQLLDELGLGAEFRELPHTRMHRFLLPVGRRGRTVVLGDFTRLPGDHDHIAMAPQWDLLSLLARAAEREPGFRLLMETEVLGPVWEGGRVAGATVRDGAGNESEIRAELTVACDGRGSALRDAAGLVPQEFDVPYDVWWFRLSRSPDEREQPPTLLPIFAGSDILLSMTREDYYQLAFLAPSGSAAEIRAAGIARFQDRIARLRPDLADRVAEIESFDAVPVLQVSLHRLHRWHLPGLLCIGDAAHAMSPSGGVGVNLAVQDAVAAARLLAGPLRSGTLSNGDLDLVRKRRRFPTWVLQTGQRVLHETIYVPAMKGRFGGYELVALALRLFPWLSGPVGRLIAIGPRPEHAPDFARRSRSP